MSRTIGRVPHQHQMHKHLDFNLLRNWEKHASQFWKLFQGVSKHALHSDIDEEQYKKCLSQVIQSIRKSTNKCTPRQWLVQNMIVILPQSQLCYTRYAALLTENPTRSTRVNLSSIFQITEAITSACQHLHSKGDRYGTQRREKVSPWYIHFSCCGWRKGMSQDELMSKSEEINPVPYPLLSYACLEALVS